MPDTTSPQSEIAKIEAISASLREALSGDALEKALLPLQQKRNLQIEIQKNFAKDEKQVTLCNRFAYKVTLEFVI